jgi:hypothetical protein
MPVRCGAELLQVLAEQCDQLGVGRNGAAVAVSVVLELAAFAVVTVVGPFAPGIG